MATEEQDLRDYSRQKLQVGRPPHFVFDAEGRPQDRELLQLSVQLRIAEALEKQDASPSDHWPEIIRIPVCVPAEAMQAFRAFMREYRGELSTFNDASKEREDPDASYTFYLLLKELAVERVLEEWLYRKQQVSKQQEGGQAQ